MIPCHTAIARLHDRTVLATTPSSSASRTQDNTPHLSAGRPRHATSLGRPALANTRRARRTAIVSRHPLTLRSSRNECGCHPDNTQRHPPGEKSGVHITCDGAVTYSCTTNERRAPPTRTDGTGFHPRTRTRAAALVERPIRVKPHMNRAKAAGQKPMFARTPVTQNICEPAREPRNMPTSMESRSAPMSMTMSRRHGRSTACVPPRRPCSPSRSNSDPTPHARSDWTML